MLLLESLHWGRRPCKPKSEVKKRTGKKYQSMLKLKDEYNNLLAKVNAVKALNKAPELWSASQLHLMVKWYKCDDDNALSSKKSDLLTRYLETCNHEDWGLRCHLKCHYELPPIYLDNGDQSVEEVLEELAV
jgi:hypothetical protein